MKFTMNFVQSFVKYTVIITETTDTVTSWGEVQDNKLKNLKRIDKHPVSSQNAF